MGHVNTCSRTLVLAKNYTYFDNSMSKYDYTKQEKQREFSVSKFAKSS